MDGTTLDRARDTAQVGDTDEAAALLREALAQLEQRDLIPPEAGTANADLGRLLHARGDDDGAVFHLVRAVFLLDKAGRYSELYEALIDLAAVHRARGEARLATASQVQAGRLRADLSRGQVACRWGLSQAAAAAV